MPSVSTDAAGIRQKNAVSRWYYPGMAVAMIAVVIAGFGPSIVDPSHRLGSITPLVALHGIMFSLWLLLFLFQTTLIATRHVSLHRRMGIVAVALLCVLVPLSYVVTVQMVRRGFDLSGDGHAAPDPLFGSIFNFVAILELPILVGAALAYRRRTAIHKRLMLFTNIMLMEVPITHFFGHIGHFSPLTVSTGTALFFVAGMAGDYLDEHSSVDNGSDGHALPAAADRGLLGDNGRLASLRGMAYPLMRRWLTLPSSSGRTRR